jgi:hypothetical protein
MKAGYRRGGASTFTIPRQNFQNSLAHPHKTGYAKNTAKKIPRFVTENKTKTIYIVANKAGEKDETNKRKTKANH